MRPDLAEHGARSVLVSGALCALLWAGGHATAETGIRGRADVVPATFTDPDIIRIPIPVPVPVPARRPGAAPLDAYERDVWRQERAQLVARARLAALPAPAPAPGTLVDISIVPPVPQLAVRPFGPQFIMPFENGRVTSMFNRGRVHPAIDLAGRLGSPVLATTRGQTVTFSGWYGGYGKAVMTRDREGRTHLYAHLSSVSVRPGMMLAQGETLGALGSTGFSTGPHVHYEVKDAGGRHIDPAKLLFPGLTVSAGFRWEDTGLRRASATASR